MATKTIELATSGMHCGSCAMLIDMTLADLEGVESSKTDHVNGSTMVTFDETLASVDDLIAAIRGVGYEASVPD